MAAAMKEVLQEVAANLTAKYESLTADDVLQRFEAATSSVRAHLENVTADDLVALKDREEVPAEVVMVTLSVLIIYLGSWWGVSNAERAAAAGREMTAAEKSRDKANVQVSITKQDAAAFPFVGSAALLSLYVAYKFASPELMNTLISLYFTAVCTYASADFLHLLTNAGPVCGVAAIALCGAWWHTRHFVANNLVAFVLSVSAVRQIRLPSFGVSWLLLWGLFLYDIWWVFGTEVMVTVAKKVDAPILMKLPKDINAEFAPGNMVMLGLGDIVIPGFFVSLCLRFDHHLAAVRKGKGFNTKYFTTALVTYVGGLVTTIAVMLLFKAAQPALLYLVPWITFGTFFVALLTGDIVSFFTYKEEEEDEEEEEKKEAGVGIGVMGSLYNAFVVPLFFVHPIESKKKTE